MLEVLIIAQVGDGAAVPAAPAAGGAAAPPGARPPMGCGGGPEQLLFIGLMLVLFYFMLIRPQQKRAKQHRELMGSLKRGDTVITASGIFGRIVDVDGNVMTLEIAKNTHIKILKSHVGGLATTDTENKLAQQPPAVGG
ncbi:MAG: preprotein translocase subunit YajC [Myxococcales bacterium]|nr:preprotein translocase subunit YajC [Myxococcales bacterium]